MKDSEGLENCTLFFRVMLSRRSNMATIMLIERDPLTQRLLVTRDMRLFVTRDLTFWHFDWHFDMFESDDMTSARAVQVRQSLSKIERPPFISWLMTTGGRKFVYVITTYLLIEGVFANWKKKLGFRLLKKKKA